MDNEVTEKLVGNNNQKPPRRLSNTAKIFIAAIVIAICVGGYFTYRYYQYHSHYNAAKESLAAGNYDDAITNYQAALNNSSDDTELYNGLAEAYLGKGDNDAARDTYNKLYDMTDEYQYSYLSQSAVEGTSPGNLSNGGLVTFQGTNDFIIDTRSSNPMVWELSNGTTTPLTEISDYDDYSGGFQTPNLNVYKDKLYYIDQDQLTSYNRKDGTIKHFDNMDISNVLQFQIYKNNIYFIKTDYQNGLNRSVCKCDLDGGSFQLITETPTIMGSAYDLFVVNDNIYVATTGAGGNYTELYEIPIDSTTPRSVYSSTDSNYGFNFAYANNKIYFNNQDTSIYEEIVFKNDVMAYDTKTGELNSIDLGEPVSAVNVYNTKLFYVTGRNIKVYDLETKEKTNIGTVEIDKPDDVNYIVDKIGISVTPDKLIVAAGYNKNWLTTVCVGANYYSADLNDLQSFSPLSLNLGSYLGLSSEAKEAYKKQVSQVFQQMINEYPDTSAEYLASYSVFDMNDDKTPELIIKEGNSEADYKYHFYTYKDGKIVDLGTVNGGHSMLVCKTSIAKGQLVRYETHMGEYGYYKIVLKDNKVSEETIDEGTVLPSSTLYPEGYKMIPYSYGNDLSLIG